jgi:hypothetical protein
MPLTEIGRCEEGEPSFFTGWPIDVYTGDAQYRYYQHRLGLAHAFREDTQKWVRTINAAVAAAKERAP